jgi:ketosteroid isomerase-like protein
MSKESAALDRFPVAIRPNRHRRMEERVAIRFPAIATFASRRVLRLPLRSKLRRLAVRRAVRLAIEATNRGDIEAAFALWAEDAETDYSPELITIGGAPAKTTSRDERIIYQRGWSGEWEGFGFQWAECIDLGDRLVVLARVGGTGPASGIRIDQDTAFLITLSEGRVMHERVILDHSEAVTAAGLSE